MPTNFDIYIVPSDQEIPTDPNCSACGITRRLVDWPYPATGEVTVAFDDTYNINPIEWASNTAYTAGDLVMPAGLTPENAGIYQAVAAGTSGSSQPSVWPRFFPGITSYNFTGYFSWTPTVSDGDILWYKRYSIRVREDHVLRIVKPEFEPAPSHIYSYEVFMKAITGCPLYSEFVFESQGLYPVVIDSGNVGGPETHPYIFRIWMTTFTNNLVAEDMHNNPNDYELYFDGVQNNHSSLNASDQALWSYYPPSGLGYGTREFFSLADEDWGDGRRARDAYFYFERDTNPVTFSHTLEFKKGGTSVGSLAFTATREYPADEFGLMLVTVTALQGTLFGQIGSIPTYEDDRYFTCDL